MGRPERVSADTRPTSRTQISAARRIVVKIGSSSVTRDDGGLDLNRLDMVARTVSRMLDSGTSVAIVSSGAVAAGAGTVGLRGRPKNLQEAQAAAAAGQGLLMAQWSAAFQMNRHRVAQVLLTVGDLLRRRHYQNAQETLGYLLDRGLVPIVNENDVVVTDEIRFGDNDRLAALVAQAIHADLLVILTDVDALYDRPPSEPGARRLETISGAKQFEAVTVTGRGSQFGTGGMMTKLAAARSAVAAGVPVLLAGADNFDGAIAGADTGTWFSATGARRATRMSWLASAALPTGTVQVDSGAARALTEDGSSLLAAGVTGVSGTFEAGSVVEIVGYDAVIARGISGYSAAEILQMAGKQSSQLRSESGERIRPVVHRDDLVVLKYPQPSNNL